MDIDELNHKIGLKGDRVLVPFSPVHVQMMELGPFERAYLESLPNYLQILEGYASLGLAYTGVDNGRPMLCWGMVQIWKGVGEWWMLPDAKLTSVRHTFHRAARRLMDVIAYEMHIVRLQCTVHTDNGPADKWIRSMQFSEEGLLKQFGPEGADYKMYARLVNGRTVQHPESSSPSSRT